MHEPSSSTSESPLEALEAEESTEYDENVLVDEKLLTEVPEVDDRCRSDEKIRCGTSSVFICEIEKCDGTEHCPNGEDEENCPGHDVGTELDDSGESGDGELKILKVPEVPSEIQPELETTTPQPEIEKEINETEVPAGDFLFYFF